MTAPYPTPDTLASKVAAEVQRRIEHIAIANGYKTDVGMRVLRGRRRINVEDLPCLVIIEPDDEVVKGTRTQCEVTLPLIVEGHMQGDPDNPNDAAHCMIGDIKRAVFTGGLFAYGIDGRLKAEIQYDGRVISPRDDGTDVVSAAVRVRVRIAEDLTNP